MEETWKEKTKNLNRMTPNNPNVLKKQRKTLELFWMKKNSKKY